MGLGEGIIEILGKAKLKIEYDKYYSIAKKFSKNEELNNPTGLVNEIVKKVSSDSKVKYVQNNFENAKKLGYGDIFWGCNSAEDFFKTYSPRKWLTVLKHNDYICGKSIQDYGYAGYGSANCGRYWFVWLIGKEIRKLAQIAADGIKKNKEASKNFSPKWSFILRNTAKSDVVMSNVIKVTVKKENKNNINKSKQKVDKFENKSETHQGQNSISKGISDTQFKYSPKQCNKTEKSKVGKLIEFFENKSETHQGQNSISKGISDTQSKSSPNQSNEIKKLKDDTSKPNIKGLKSLRINYITKRRLKKALNEILENNVSKNNDILTIEKHLNEKWTQEYKNHLSTAYKAKNAKEYLEKSCEKFLDYKSIGDWPDEIKKNIDKWKKEKKAESEYLNYCYIKISNLAYELLKKYRANFPKNSKFISEIKINAEKAYNELKGHISDSETEISNFKTRNTIRWVEIYNYKNKNSNFISEPIEKCLNFINPEGLNGKPSEKFNGIFSFKNYLSNYVKEKESLYNLKTISIEDIIKAGNVASNECANLILGGEDTEKAEQKVRENFNKNIKNIETSLKDIIKYNSQFIKEAQPLIDEAYKEINEIQSQNQVNELMKKSENGTLEQKDKETLMNLLQKKRSYGNKLTPGEKSKLDSLLHEKGIKTEEELNKLSDDELFDYLSN